MPCHAMPCDWVFWNVCVAWYHVQSNRTTHITCICRALRLAAAIKLIDLLPLFSSPVHWLRVVGLFSQKQIDSIKKRHQCTGPTIQFCPTNSFPLQIWKLLNCHGKKGTELFPRCFAPIMTLGGFMLRQPLAIIWQERPPPPPPEWEKKSSDRQ